MKSSSSLARSFWFILLVAGITSPANTWPVRTQQKLPTAEEILEKFIEATGGRQAYEKLHNRIITARIEFVETGISGTTAEYKADPNRSYRVVDLVGVGKTEAGTDGNVCWERSSETGPRIKTGEEKAAAMREATFNPALHWRELYGKAECVGEEKVDDQLCYKVVLTPKEGKPIQQYYDEKSGLLVKIAMLSMTPSMGEIPSETFLGEYKSVSGVLVPHEQKRKLLLTEIDTHIQSVQFNAEIPKDRFDLPADIKSLLGK
jgi:hypothetical protein